MTCLWLICTCLAVIGSCYCVFAAMQIRRFFANERALPSVEAPFLTLLKPLCGPELGLEANIASFVEQDYPGPVQIVFGVQDAGDPAADVVRRAIETFPRADIDLIVDPHLHGANRKISNVINIHSKSRGEVVVLSDSDIRVGPTYLRQITSALHASGVGLVTCRYRGLPVGGLWSRLAAAEINYRFLPSVLVGLRLGLAKPCFGSTIALRTGTLAQIGGFAAFADQLADDYAIGAAVRRLGLTVAIPPVVVDHVCSETSFRELVRRELRWANTIRLVDPIGFVGSVVTHPLPFAIAAVVIAGMGGASIGLSLGVLVLTLACCFVVPLQFGRILGRGFVPVLLAPVRDLLSFGIFLASFLASPVSWRGHRYRVRPDGTLTPA
jgi:ceramide glucosyltransferase